MTDRLQQKAEAIVRETFYHLRDASSEYIRKEPSYKILMLGLTAGIAIAAEPGQAQILAAAQAMWECNQTASYPFSSEVPHVREYWIIRAELALAAALAKGETQHG